MGGSSNHWCMLVRKQLPMWCIQQAPAPERIMMPEPTDLDPDPDSCLPSLRVSPQACASLRRLHACVLVYLQQVRRGACVAVMQLRALAPLALYESLAKPWAPGQVAAVKKGLVAAGLLDLDRELATFLRTKRLDPAVAEEANRLLASAIASTSKPGTAPHADDEAGRLHANVQALANGSASAYARDLVANRVGAEDQEGAGEGGSGEDADSAGASGRWRQLVGVEKTVGQGWTAPVYNPTAYQVGEESDEDSGWGGAGVDSGGAEDDVEEIKLTEDGGLEQDGIISATLVLPGDASLPCAHKRRSGCGAWAREDVDYSLGSGGHAGKRQAGFGWKEGWAEGGREEVVGAEMRQGGGSNKTNHVAYPNSQAAREAAVDEGEGEGEGEEEGEGRSGQRASGRAWSGEREAQEKGQRWASAAEGRGARGRGGEYKQRGDGGTMPGLRVGTELCDVGGKAEWERVLSRALGGVTSAAKHGHDAQTQEALVALLSVCKQVPAHLWRPAGGKGSGGGGLLVQLLVVLGEMTKHASGGGVLGAGGQGPSRTAMGAEVLDKVLHVYEWVVGGLAEECGGMCMSHVLVEALLSAVSAAATPMSRSTLSKVARPRPYRLYWRSTLTSSFDPPLPRIPLPPPPPKLTCMLGRSSAPDCACLGTTCLAPPASYVLRYRRHASLLCSPARARCRSRSSSRRCSLAGTRSMRSRPSLALCRKRRLLPCRLPSRSWANSRALVRSRSWPSTCTHSSFRLSSEPLRIRMLTSARCVLFMSLFVCVGGGWRIVFVWCLCVCVRENLSSYTCSSNQI
jgi:hypothetical protein